MIKEYDRLRQEAKQLQTKRLAEIYEKIPRYKEIDMEISVLSMSSAKKIMLLTDNAEKELLKQELRNDLELLEDEKIELLLINKIKPSYINSIFLCEKCEDTGYIGKSKCPCLQQKLINKYYEIANLTRFADSTFNDFNLNYYSKEIPDGKTISPYDNTSLIMRGALKFIDDFKTTKSNLVFTGQVGLGKTFISCCIANKLLQKGFTVLYLTSPDLFKLLEKSQFSNSSDDISEYVNTLFSVSLLIIDDLGTEFATQFTQAALFRVLNDRLISTLNGGLSTIVSTNCTIDDLQEAYGERITSRIIGNYTRYTFIGDDIRPIKKFQLQR